MAETLTIQTTSESLTINTPTTTEVVSVVQAGPQGPQGPAGSADFGSPPPIGNVVPNSGAFTTISASGLAILPHIHGALAGNLYVHVKNTNGTALSRGAAVYVKGNVGATDRVEVGAASYNDPAKMPAIGLLEQDLLNNGTGDAVIVGELQSANTAAYALNQELYVGFSGQLTESRPTSGVVQSVGTVSRVQSNTGVIVVNMQGTRSPNEAFAAAVTDIELTPNGTTTITTAQLPARGIAFTDGEMNFTVNLPTPNIRQSGLTFSLKRELEGAGGEVFVTVVHNAVTLMITELEEAEGSIDFLWDGYEWTRDNFYVLRSTPSRTLILPQSSGTLALTQQRDDSFRILGSVDQTKRVAFEVDGLSSGTTRTLTVPNASGTLALTSDFAAPPAIGNTTPAAGNFTTIRVDPKTGGIGSLVVGSTTGGETNHIVLDGAGIKIRAGGSNEVATIATPTLLSADRSYQLPNASGTLALTSDFASPPAIGNTTPAAGTFSTLAANTSLAVAGANLTGASNVLEMVNGSNAQTLRIYGSYSLANIFSRLSIRGAPSMGGNHTIATEKGTTGGTARGLDLQTNSVTRLTLGETGGVTVASGNLVVTDNTGGETATFEAQNKLTANRTYDLPNASGTLALTQQSSDMEITDSTKGIILKSPNNTRWRITIDNAGSLIRTALAILLFGALGSTATAQVRDLVYGTNNVVVGPTNTNALTFTNRVSLPISSGAANSGAVLSADGSGGSAFVGYVGGEIFDFTTTSGPAGATAVTNGITNVVWTWTAPTKFTRLTLILVGGGAGGGSGRVSDTNVAAGGGGGGSGGSIMVADYPNMGGPLTITVPLPAAGGASQTTNNSNGLAGTAGRNATVAWTNGIIPRAGGGNAGGAGTTVGGAGGGSPSASTEAAGGGGSANVASGTGNASDLASGRGNVGGSAGGSISSANALLNGSSGRINSMIAVATFGGVSTEGSVGQLAVPIITNSLFGNPGGGGGGASLTNNGGAGASPTTFGSGGGGGAAARNGFASGAGGSGGAGAVRIIGQ